MLVPQVGLVISFVGKTFYKKDDISETASKRLKWINIVSSILLGVGETVSVL